MGSELSTSLSIDPSFLHSSRDVVEKEKITQFCRTWNLQRVSFVIERFKRSVAGNDNVVQLENEIRQLKEQIQQSNNELKLLLEEPDHDEKHSSNLNEALVELNVALKEKQERFLHLSQPQRNGINKNISWSTYVATLRDADRIGESELSECSVEDFSHPAFRGLSFEIDSTSQAELRDMAVESVLEGGGIDCHTDDSASDSVSDGESIDGDSSIASPVPQPAVEALPEEPKAAKVEVKGNFDPTIRSPVFFGYSIKPKLDPRSEYQAMQEVDSAREVEIFESRISELRDDIETELQNEKSKLRALEQRKARIVERRQKEESKRQIEYETGLKELGENTTEFIATFNVTAKEISNAEKAEDDKIEREKESIVTRIETMSASVDEKVEKLRALFVDPQSLGNRRILYHQDKIHKYECEVRDAQKTFDMASNDYAEVMKKFQHCQDKPQARSQILLVEGQVRIQGAGLHRATKKLQDEEFLLVRAADYKAQEDKYRPLFDALAETTSIRVVDLLLFFSIYCHSSLKEKIHFLFESYCDIKGKLLHQDGFLDIIRGVFATLEKVGDIHPTQQVNAHELESLAHQAFSSRHLKIEFGMPLYDFTCWSISTIQRSKYLSEILQEPWRFRHMSRYQRQYMSDCHQFKIGLITLSDLSFRIARQSSKFHPVLSPGKIEVLHERALSMGHHDTLKTDYTKYLPQHKQKLHSSVVPLDHGCFGNIIYWKKNLENRSSTIIQRHWRGKSARKYARQKLKMHAFYHSKGKELHSTRARILHEWKEKKLIQGVAKMKFDGKVRLRQVKYRASGHILTPDQVMLLMMDEDLTEALKQTECRFLEMEYELGYIKSLNTGGISNGPPDLSSALRQQLEDGRKRIPGIEAVLAQMEQKNGQVEEVPESDSLSENIQETSGTASLSRIEYLICGEHPAEIFKSGDTIEEVKMRHALTLPDASWGSMFARLQKISTSMTDLKTFEMMLELPSKRLVCAYALRFSRPSLSLDKKALEEDLSEHFRIKSNTATLAHRIISITETDLEFGLLPNAVDRWNKDQEKALYPLTTEQHEIDTKISKELAAKRERTLKIRQTSEESSVRSPNADGTLQLKKLEVEQVRKKVEEACSQWKLAELSLREIERRHTTADCFPVQVKMVHRLDWNRRFYRILEVRRDLFHDTSTKASLDEIRNVNIEIRNIIDDFVGISKQVSAQIISDYHMPAHERSLQPIKRVPIDGRRDEIRYGWRETFSLYNIIFKLAIDDHEMYDGSDEAAMKAAANALRSSEAYFSTKEFQNLQIRLPLQCNVDFHGMRMSCSVRLPIDIIKYNERFEARHLFQQHIYGTIDRGKHVACHDKELLNRLTASSKELNICPHFVRGSLDLTSKSIVTAADLQGFSDENNNFYVVHFHRCMPPEDPSFATHIPQSPRGQSVFWRTLRPEFVSRYREPLSPDAFSMITKGVPDAEENELRIGQATRAMLVDAIDQLAISLLEKVECRHSNDGGNPIPEIEIAKLMHHYGVNLRHMGLLRTKYAYWLAGTCTLSFNHRELLTTHDISDEVSRGAVLQIKGIDYTISVDPQDVFNGRTVTVDPVYSGDSCRDVRMLSGKHGRTCYECSLSLRTLLLAEMIARAMKQLLRQILRIALRKLQIALPQRHRQLIVNFLNIITGSVKSCESRAFWDCELFLAVRSRFGEQAISMVDRKNLKNTFQGPWLIHIIRRLRVMTGIQWSRNCEQRFVKNPDGFTFTFHDVENPLPVARHNSRCLMYTSTGSIFAHDARVVQETTYSAVIRQDRAVGYWPLDERRGSCIAKNHGTGGRHLQGTYRGRVDLEQKGYKITNDPLERSTYFSTDGQVSIKANTRFSPADPEQHVSMEAWARIGGGENTTRVLISFGRFSLTLLKTNQWGFVSNVHKMDVIATDATSEQLDKTGEKFQLQHLVGTCDGTNLRIYVNGDLKGNIDMVSAVALQLKLHEDAVNEKRESINQQAEDAKIACWRTIEIDATEFFRSKDGDGILKNLAKRVQEEHEFRQRLASGSEESSTKKNKLGKKEAYTLAKKMYVKEKFELQCEDIETERATFLDALDARLKLEEQERTECDSRPLSIGCMSSKGQRGGRNFFQGHVCHVAYYDYCLSHDQVLKHYFWGTCNRANDSDNLFEEASTNFKMALRTERDNKYALEYYASNICQSLRYDLDHISNRESYKLKVSRSIHSFSDSQNTNALAEILRSLPADAEFAGLFVDAYSEILRLDPNYFTPESYLGLEELGAMRVKFQLGRLADDNERIVQSHADLIRRVVQHYPMYFGNHPMKWLTQVRDDQAVVSLVLRLEDGANINHIDLTKCIGIEDSDVEIISSNITGCRKFNASNCVKLTDTSFQCVVTRCQRLEELRMSGCKEITDATLNTIEKVGCQYLTAVDLGQCHRISDVGAEALLRAASRLEVLSLRYCDKITDDALRTLGKYCRNLESLDIGFCFQISDVGVLDFCSTETGKHVKSVDLSACRRITDVGVVALTKRCSKLKKLNLFYCTTVTDVGVMSITHNCLAIEDVNLHDLIHVTDRPFYFDLEGDGRPVVEQHMLKNLKKLTIAGCKSISDRGLAAICHRAVHLETLNAAGCIHLSDQGLKFINTDMYDKSRICENLLFLDLSFCTELTDTGMRYLIHANPKLRAIHLTGCVNITSPVFVQLVQKCTHIQSISVGYCREINDSVLNAMAKYLWLEELVLTRCVKITDQAVCNIASEFSGLRVLNLAWCKNLTNRSIVAITEGCQKLQQLDVSHCPLLSTPALKHLHARGVQINQNTEKETPIVKEELTDCNNLLPAIN